MFRKQRLCTGTRLVVGLVFTLLLAAFMFSSRPLLAQGPTPQPIYLPIVISSGGSGTTLEGTFNELVHLNGIFDAETVDSMLKRADDWGGPNSFPHMSCSWAVATDAPFAWTKQMAADFGGTRNGMVMH